jgi:multicomponent Na+:H+ antiporter subunit D
MTSNLPVLAVLFPFFSGLLSALLPARGLWVIRLGMLAMLACTGVCLKLFLHVLEVGTVTYHLSGWAPPLGIEFKVTVLSGFFSWLLALTALLAYLGGRYTWSTQVGQRAPQFQALLFLLLASYQGLALTNDAFNMFVMLEVSSLATYGLIAFGGGRAYLATFQYLVMGTIGASFYLLGVGYLYIKTGTLNIDDLAQILAQLPQSPAITIGLAMMLVGILLKMAIFPLHAWLPNAYFYAPDAASAQIAPLSTKLAAFMLFRVLHDFFAGSVPQRLPEWPHLMTVLASLGILAGVSTCLAQRNLKRTFACLIVAEAGYMMGGLWLSDVRGPVGALFHLANDMLVTVGLFIAAMAVQRAMGGQSRRHLPGLFTESPITGAALILLALNVIGVPPMAGFFSKATLISGAIASGHYEFAVALILASLGCMVIFFRFFEEAFFRPDADSGDHDPDGSHHRLGILALVVGLFLLTLGLWNEQVMEVIIRPAVLS